jgi:hypothetical protein
MTSGKLAAETIVESDAAPVTVFIVSWGRPIYFWSCLDALFRLTRSRANFVLLDNAHPDPMTGEVIRGFERRGMFLEVVRFPTNSWENIRSAYLERLAGLGPLHVFMESDCVVGTREPCWLAAMRRIMEGSPRLGMLGSLIEPGDFVPAEVACKLTGGDMQEAAFLAKLASPEREFLEDPRWAESEADYFLTGLPCPIANPPGRLLMLRTDVMLRIGLHVDGVMTRLMHDSGYLTGVTPRVRHRHLSLLNIFDYDGYDERQRQAFFTDNP